MTPASGLLFLTPDSRALFLKRSEKGDHAGEWCFPGGKIEDGETPEQAAVREAEEETGVRVKVEDLTQLARTRSSTDPSSSSEAEVDFTTFTVRVKEPFEVRPDDEHVGHAWVPVGDPPMPLHPGCAAALARLEMKTELDVARAIASGQLTSPQKYANSWLFAMRITGTGAAYRTSLKEYVWRDPSIYMCEEFLARVAGLPIILEHPEESTLNTKEYARRNIGYVIFPYLRPEAQEVWGITRIIDAPAAHLMEERRLSTSPAVVFHDPDANTKLKDSEGRIVLLEGVPSLVDHLAVCEQGVWDKGGEPRGIESANVKEVTMADEDKRAADDKARMDAEEKARADAEQLDNKLVKLADSVGKMRDAAMATNEKFDSMAARMDAFEARLGKPEADAKKDGEGEDEPKKEDKPKDAKKDGEEENDPKKEDKPKDGDPEDDKPVPVAADKKKDAARKDAATMTTSIMAELAELRRRLEQPTDTDRRALAAAQERADSAFSALGTSAQPPMAGEGLLDYRLRLVSKLVSHSPTWKGREIARLVRADAVGKLPEGQTPLIDLIEAQVYSDAVKAAEKNDGAQPYQYREIKRADETGRRITTFHGIGSFVRQFTRVRARLAPSRPFATPQNPLHEPAAR